MLNIIRSIRSCYSILCTGGCQRRFIIRYPKTREQHCILSFPETQRKTQVIHFCLSPETLNKISSHVHLFAHRIAQKQTKERRRCGFLCSTNENSSTGWPPGATARAANLTSRLPTTLVRPLCLMSICCLKCLLQIYWLEKVRASINKLEF